MSPGSAATGGRDERSSSKREGEQVTINTEPGNLAGPYEDLGHFGGADAEARAKGWAEQYARDHGVSGGTGCVVMVGEPGVLPTLGYTMNEGWMAGGFRPTVALPGYIETAGA